MKALLEEMVAAGIPQKMAEEQVQLAERGSQYVSLVESARIGCGILQLNDEELDCLSGVFQERSVADLRVLKFVPASGAATRMFKELKAYREGGEMTSKVKEFFNRIDDFAFASNWKTSSHEEILSKIFGERGLSDCPKGSIPFHHYPTGARTAFEEHLNEGASYAKSKDTVHLHFTLPLTHREELMQRMETWKAEQMELTGAIFHIESSVQEKWTDTLAFSKKNEPIRKEDGTLFTRPGGHGALIHNLNGIEADIIFVKNIDNVVPGPKRKDTLRYKKALAGLLLQFRQEALSLWQHSAAEETQEQREALLSFLEKVGIRGLENKSQLELRSLLQRPFRVCGMVRNEGEPGGGPFWIKSKAAESLQIVESAQIDTSQPGQAKMLENGTHFNPVDLVCCPKDLQGNKLNLLGYVDKDTAFVTVKQVMGQEAKVIEWPGLWNGAMANWNTIFVEVPVTTFNPVKTVNDLLRPMHQ